jgi:hypothetical protein
MIGNVITRTKIQILYIRESRGRKRQGADVSTMRKRQDNGREEDNGRGKNTYRKDDTPFHLLFQYLL